MSSPDTADTAAHDAERATYDIAATETKWQRVWGSSTRSGPTTTARGRSATR